MKLLTVLGSKEITISTNLSKKQNTLFVEWFVFYFSDAQFKN